MAVTLIRKLFNCCNNEFVVPPTPKTIKAGSSLPEIPPFDESSRRISIYQESDIYKEGEHWRKMKEGILGSGHFGTCYQALDVVTGTLMAVKEVKIGGSDAANADDLKDEIEVLGRLNHQNIVRILGATQEVSHMNIFLEWMPGGSVSSLLAKFGPFHEYVIIRYIKQVLTGLAYLHDKQLIHRDLKGANILVDGTGQRIRISDFGTVGCLNSPVTEPGEFKGQLIGTLPFMAPEVLRGGDYGRSSDIWSVGCVIIEMASAQPPWTSETTPISNYYQLFYLIARTQEPPPIPKSLTNSTKTLALKCLKLSPKRRPSAQTLLQNPLFYISPKILVSRPANSHTQSPTVQRRKPSPPPATRPPSESDDESSNTESDEDSSTSEHDVVSTNSESESSPANSSQDITNIMNLKDQQGYSI